MSLVFCFLFHGHEELSAGLLLTVSNVSGLMVIFKIFRDKGKGTVPAGLGRLFVLFCNQIRGETENDFSSYPAQPFYYGCSVFY